MRECGRVRDSRKGEHMSAKDYRVEVVLSFVVYADSKETAGRVVENALVRARLDTAPLVISAQKAITATEPNR